MAYLAVDKDGQEAIYQGKPVRENDYWEPYDYLLMSKDCIELPKGSIAKLIGRELTWEDEPVELKASTNEWCENEL